MSSDFQKLRRLILQKEIDKLEDIIERVKKLENSHQKSILINNLSLLLSEILKKNIERDSNQIYKLLHPIISKALKSDLRDSKEELIELLSPLISTSIKEQVHKQKESVVDALYPIMGNMISKYVTNSFKHMIEEINSKLQNSLSFSTIKRKLKSKIYKIPEAELLLQETTFAEVKTIFLIHKESGLLILDIHKSQDAVINEPEMVASMLSAIRSFVNEWISNNNKMSEISEIEYGTSSIVIESAGSCYLAVVVDGGEPDFKLKEEITDSLKEVIKINGEEIAEFEGDSSNLNISKIKKILSKLFKEKKRRDINNKNSSPIFAILFFTILIIIPTFWYGKIYYKKYIKERREERVKDYINKKGIKIYDFKISTNKIGEVTIDGLVFDRSDKEILNKIDNIKIINRVVSLDEEFSQKYLKIELERTINYFNQKYHSNLSYKFIKNQIYFKGKLINEEAKEDFIIYTLMQFKEFKINFNIETLPKLEEKIYFKLSSDEISEKYNLLLDKIANYIKNNNNYIIKIIGYTDDKGSLSLNYELSLKRANSVKKELLKRGISEERLKIDALPIPPKELLSRNGIENKKLARCVKFIWEINKSD